MIFSYLASGVFVNTGSW